MILHHAYEYLDRGWPVIPTNGKTPACAWSAYQKKLPTGELIRKWFADSEFNLAIVTGKQSGLVVVDCDSIEDACWWRLSHPETPLEVATGRGGIHFYYRYPYGLEVGNRAGVSGRQVDIRGEGGLIIAPPSIHPDTNRQYAWKEQPIYCLDDVPIFNPDWIETNVEPVAYRITTTEIHRGLSYIRRIRAVSGDGGHNATFRAACKLRDSGMTADEALAALIEWNETNASPPWSERELSHKVHDAFKLA